MTEPASVLWIAHEALLTLKNCAVAAYPEECCGLLVGYNQEAGLAEGAKGKRISRVHPTKNCAAAPRCAFEIDPAAHIALLRNLREGVGGGHAEQMLGHYHSHPDSAPVPSARDLAQAMEFDALWVIIGAGPAAADDIRAWLTVREPGDSIGFRPLRIVLSD
jgi:proteasome lid subunit RPN8/RPN11